MRSLGLKMDDLKHLISDNYIQYASYVILERAIPDALDGLKPVQRRILHALYKMHDGRFHKVANIVGQTMAYHPHGDMAIYDALVNLANKEYTIDRQGNFGNLHTGDPAAASRYIEARLCPLALKNLFHKDLTQWIPSYDGRSAEPVRLPARIPLLLLHGAEGIAVGMSTKIFPHNFNEVLRAQIAYLKNKSFDLYPDFPSGGLIDISEYKDGQGKIRIRAVIEAVDDKTLRITQICASTTTESLINSIDDAAKKGKIKIESIHDFTAQDVAVEIKLPRGQHSHEVKQALYAFTQCEVSVTAIPTVIHQGEPRTASVSELVQWHAEYLKDILRRELILEQKNLMQQLFLRTLEQIFIENRLYRNLEKVKKSQDLHRQVSNDLQPFIDQLIREPQAEDLDHLLALPMRRISLYDKNANEEAMAKIQARLLEIEKYLTNLVDYTISYLEGLLKEYGGRFKRRSEIREFSRVDYKDFDQRKVKVSLDIKGGYLGTKVQGSVQFDAKPHDKLVVFYQNGSYAILAIEEKQYIKLAGTKILSAQVVDPDCVYNVAYTHVQRPGAYIKRFSIKQFTTGKVYHFLNEDEKFKTLAVGLKGKLRVKFAKTARAAASSETINLDEVPIKSYKVRGQRFGKKEAQDIRIQVED